jgi:hypothetical protein
MYSITLPSETPAMRRNANIQVAVPNVDYHGGRVLLPRQERPAQLQDPLKRSRTTIAVGFAAVYEVIKCSQCTVYGLS